MKRQSFIICLIAAVCSVQSMAIGLNSNSEVVHFSEHFLATAAIFSGTYLVSEKLLGVNKTNSLILSAVTALAVGFAYKMGESTAEGYASPNLGQAMLFNCAGVVVPAAFAIGFNF